MRIDQCQCDGNMSLLLVPDLTSSPTAAYRTALLGLHYTVIYVIYCTVLLHCAPLYCAPLYCTTMYCAICTVI